MVQINSLKTEEVYQLLNNVGYGKVITTSVLETIKKANEIKFVSKGKVDLLKMLESMLDKKHNKLVKKSRTQSANYENEKEYQRQRNAERSASGRDIGAIPEIVNPQRRKDCQFSLRKFLLTYFKKQAFYYEFSQAMEEAIIELENRILHGGSKALAMPRSSGKTTLLEVGVQWAILYAHRLYIVFIGATVKDGLKSLDAIKTSIETNELLEEDFPEVVFPIKALEGINIRANGQMCLGKRTHISWGSDELILPTIEGAATSGIILEATGMEGRIRGRKHVNQTGKNLRPDFVACDDFQTDESAANLEQCKKRLGIINRAVMGLAGVGKSIACFIPCTVIQQGDAADQLLDRTKYPQFMGSKTRMMISFPINMELWEEYSEVRDAGFASGLGVKPSNQFYIENREKLDEGCEVYWNDRYDRTTVDKNGNEVIGEISAIQSAMNLFFKNEDAFYSEYQNEPKSLIVSLEIMKATEFAKKLNKVPQSVVPVNDTRLFSFIDIQKKCLYYTTLAFSETFSGDVIDYGTFPDQKNPYYLLKDVKITIEKMYPEMGFEDALFASLNTLVNTLAEREYTSQSGGVLRHSNIMIDANWGISTETVYEFCRKSKHANILLPSHGMKSTAASTPFSEYKKKKGDRIGDHWRIPIVKGKRATPYMLYDTNYWKTFVHTRINTGVGGNGCLSLFGDLEKRHELYTEQLCKSEYVIETEGRNRKVHEWKAQVSFTDNHFFDCTVGCHVLASQNGINLGVSYFKNDRKKKELISLNSIQTHKNQQQTQEKPQISQENTRKPISLAEIQKNKLENKPKPR